MQNNHMLENLEPRRHLSANPYLTANGTLVINGTRRNEVIQIESDATGRVLATVSFHRKIIGAARFRPSQVKRYQIDAGDGNDQIVLKAANVRSGTINGGGGDDAIYAVGDGLKADGGDGDDRISLFSANHTTPSTLLGGAGRDRLQAGPGVFQLDGGAGNDILFHAGFTAHFDRPIQNGASDRVIESISNAFRSAEGEASLYGGEGNDLIYPASTDAIFGGPGRDHLMFTIDAPGIRKTGYTYDTDGVLAEQIGAYDTEVTQFTWN